MDHILLVLHEDPLGIIQDQRPILTRRSSSTAAMFGGDGSSCAYDLASLPLPSRALSSFASGPLNVSCSAHVAAKLFSELSCRQLVPSTLPTLGSTTAWDLKPRPFGSAVWGLTPSERTHRCAGRGLRQVLRQFLLFQSFVCSLIGKSSCTSCLATRL